MLDLPPLPIKDRSNSRNASVRKSRYLRAYRRKMLLGRLFIFFEAREVSPMTAREKSLFGRLLAATARGRDGEFVDPLNRRETRGLLTRF